MRALPAALADFKADAPRTREMLDEMGDSDPTLAELYMRAILEEVPVTMLGELLRPDMLEKLRTLEWFRDYEVKVKAEADAEAKVKSDAAQAEAAVARAAVAAAEALTVKAVAKAVADALTDFLVTRGDKPSEYAMKKIGACRDSGVLAAWLKRAYQGETSAQLFPEPNVPAS